MDYFVSFVDLAARLESGDQEAAAEIVRRYGPRLAALARRRLHAIVRPRLDPEDIVQSVFRSFFQRQARSGFTLDGWDTLWRLLACMTVRECARKGSRTVPEMADPIALATTQDRQPTPDEAVCLADTVEHLLYGLSESERDMLLLRLQGYSSREVGQSLGCSERKVQRLVVHVRGRLDRLQAQAR
jgi:RNA polymerase sigma-70 factor (ECF subfamily)